MVNIKKFSFFDKIAIFITLLFILAGSIVSVLRYWQYETFYFDFGVYDSAIWKVAHFQPPIIDHFIVSGKINFADHFNPSVFLLSPLYWLTDKQEIILIAQAAIAGLAGLALYFLGKKIIKNSFASIAVLTSYFLFLGLQNAVITDFHEVTVATLPLALTFWAIIAKKVKWFIIAGLLTLGFKETLFLLGVAMGIFIILFNRQWFKIGLMTSLFSLVYGLFTIKFLIPYFSGGVYVYGENIDFGIARFIIVFLDNPEKLDTIKKSLWSFSFLPIFSPPFWILILEDFGVRFYSSAFGTRIGLGLHYSALLSVIMAVSGIYGLRFLSLRLKKVHFHILLALIILNSVFLYRFVLHGPFALAYNPAFYKHTSDFKFLDQLVSKVPKESSVMTQNNIASHFTHQEVYFIRMDYKKFDPDYILIDGREGQNPNNFFGDRGFNVEKFLIKISKDKCYKTIFKADYQYIFKKSC